MKVWVAIAINESGWEGDSQWFDSVYSSLDEMKEMFKEYQFDQKSKCFRDKEGVPQLLFFEQEMNART